MLFPCVNGIWFIYTRQLENLLPQLFNPLGFTQIREYLRGPFGRWVGNHEPVHFVAAQIGKVTFACGGSCFAGDGDTFRGDILSKSELGA